jgi:hypothetical protein
MKIALLLLCLTLPLIAESAPHRGVWFWNATKITVGGSTVDSPHSSKFVVGDSALEDNAIAFMKCHKIKEVYGSYQHRPRDFPLPIRAWNAKLDVAGIESQLLISGFEETADAQLTDPNHVSLVTKVQDRLIDFNNTPGITAAEQFDALHLDLEPQSLDFWKDLATPAQKRVYLDHLLDAYVDIREALDLAGFTGFPIYADIPYTWDKMPIDGGSVGWMDETDRNNWFAAISGELTGLSIMTFSASKDTALELAEATEYERTSGYFGGVVHVAIQPKFGAGNPWDTYPEFSNMLISLEGAYSEVHVENYAFWRQAVSDYGPTIAKPCFTLLYAHAEPAIINTGNGTGGVIVIGSAGYTYRLRFSTDLDGDGWKDVDEIWLDPRDGIRQEITFPIQMRSGRGFWKVSETPDGAS